MNVTKENPYARFFRSLREIPVEQTTTIILNKNAVPDQRVYNAPSVDEVAGIWPDDSNSSNSNSPHIVVQGNHQTHIEFNTIMVVMIHYSILFYFQEVSVVGLRDSRKRHGEEGNNQLNRLILLSHVLFILQKSYL